MVAVTPWTSGERGFDSTNDVQRPRCSRSTAGSEPRAQHTTANTAPRAPCAGPRTRSPQSGPTGFFRWKEFEPSNPRWLREGIDRRDIVIFNERGGNHGRRARGCDHAYETGKCETNRPVTWRRSTRRSRCFPWTVAPTVAAEARLPSAVLHKAQTAETEAGWWPRDDRRRRDPLRPSRGQSATSRLTFRRYLLTCDLWIRSARKFRWRGGLR